MVKIMKKDVSLGIIVSLATAILSIIISDFIGISLLEFRKSPISPIIIAIMVGLLLNNVLPGVSNYSKGYKFCVNYLLKFGIILLGIRLSLFDFIQYGSKSLLVIIPCIFCVIILIDSLKDKFNVSTNLALLIAVGTSICGATAIVALAPSINAKKTEITYAIANITIFGLLAMFLYPIIANIVFANNDLGVGLFLGSSIHETAQVAGSSMIYAEQYLKQDVVGIATLTKLVRNTLMVFVIPFLAHRSLSSTSKNHKITSIFPFFIIGFLIFGLIRTIGDYYFTTNNTYGSIQWDLIILYIKKTAEFLLIIAMAAVGYNTNFKYFKDLGIKPFYLGFIAASTVGIISMLVITIAII